MRFTPIALALALPLAVCASAMADQKLAPDQQTKVEEVLKKEGFTKWKKIEMEHGMIEVDDAIDANGKEFDLKLDPNSLAIVKREADDD
ncbi:PepSY domain-containing protein [Methylobacterium nigriterrae]|uniref:PepSY domain-containing protein n=1 Tax=Methylobacterium nigriterrae TaxID=3127512 RepID=UPI0030133558